MDYRELLKGDVSMQNKFYHEFTPGKLEPTLIVAALLGLLAVIALSYFVVRIKPIGDRVRRYHSVGSKAAKVANSHRRSGTAPRDEDGLAIIMPSTSFDWAVGIVYAAAILALAAHYHGAGLLQLLLNHGFGIVAYIVLIIAATLVIVPITVLIQRFVQFISARIQFLAVQRETGEKIHIYEEWGLYDRWCRKEFDDICRSLNKREKKAVRAAVSDPRISEKTKLDRATSFIQAQDKLKKKTKPKEFELMLDSFVEFVYKKAE